MFNGIGIVLKQYLIVTFQLIIVAYLFARLDADKRWDSRSRLFTLSQ